MAEISLSCLKVGQQGSVTKICAEKALAARLQELGLIEGTEIRCIRESPAGDPVLYGVRGSMLALRKRDSAGIFVEAAK